MDIYSTYYMMAALEEMPLEHNFFKQRYFPTNTAMDIFGTSFVLADYRENTLKRAPFVLPRVGALPVGREGFSTATLEPANIAISKPLTADQLTNRGFGESLLSTATPADRARRLLMGDLADLNARISRTEEILAVQTMLNNGCTMLHRTDDPAVYEEVGAKFYDGENNPAEFTPAQPWQHSTYDSTEHAWVPGNWYDDMCAMIKMLTKKGRPVRDVIVSPDVGDFLMEDGWVLAMLDNRRVEMGHIAPQEICEYMYQVCTINFKGRVLPIIVDDGTYEEGGVDVPYLPGGTVIITAPGCGRGLYGAVTQMTTSGQWETVAGTRIPLHIFTVRPPANETQVTARPLFVPNRPNPWTVAKDVFGTAGSGGEGE